MASQSENAINNVFNDLYRGQQVETGRGISALRHSKLTEHPDSVAAISSKMTRGEIKVFTEVVGDMIKRGSTTELMAEPDKFLPKNEARLVKALKKMGDDGLRLTNETRAKQGIEPLEGRDDWLVSYVRHGKYHLFSLDKDGKSTYRKGFNSLSDGRKVLARLKAKGFHDLRLVRAANDPRRVVLPPEAFYQAKRMVETAEQRDILDKAIEEASLRMGTKKYGKARDSKAGGLPLAQEEIEALGHEKTFDNFMFGVKAYANSTARYVGTNSGGYAQKVYQMFADNEIELDYPNEINAARQRWEDFQGVNASLDDVSKVFSFLNQAFLHTNIVALNPVFWGANVLQFGFSSPRMILENERTLGGKGNVPLATMKALSSIYYDHSGGDTKAIMKEAVRNGSIEA
ncbi:MAG: hypothetical protein L0Y56_10725, partial [Nitrospira sp.]|nr:hypothetical protein [Nitrospira sp.]